MAYKKAPQEGGAKVRGDYEVLARPFSPPNKPIDAATN
jgi:hypothetical protein